MLRAISFTDSFNFQSDPIQETILATGLYNGI